jgi:glycosyltransferase involved in cell wall biosynthesis
MKIACCCRVYPTHRPGGMPFVCQDRAEALAVAGHEVHVLTTGHPTCVGGGYSATAGSVTVHYLNAPNCKYSQEYAEACRQMCETLRPDILHLDSFDGIRPWWKDRPGGVKRVAITLHGFGPGAFFTQWNRFRVGDGERPEFNASVWKTEADNLRAADAVIGISQYEYEMLVDFYGLPNAKLVYNPIPSYFFANRQPVPECRRFLCAAVAGHMMRNFDHAQEAAKRAGVELVVASRVPRHEMPAVYDRCCGLIVPTSYAQGFDLSVAEATTRGRAVIATATGSYLREADAYDIQLFPLGEWDALESLLRDWRPVNVRPLWRHQPEIHARAWLEAVA